MPAYAAMRRPQQAPSRAGSQRGRGPKVTPEKVAELANISLHYGQAEVWRAREHGYRILNMFAGTGGGKTWFGPRFWYPIIRERPEATFLFTEPTWRMLKRVMLPMVLEYFDAFNMGRMHLGDMVYELHSGGRILFGSIDNPNSLQGVHVTGGVWADEIGMYREDAWDVLLQRGALHRVVHLNTSTPYTLPWIERRLYKPSLPGQPDSDEYWSIQFPSWWNPGYPKEQFFKLKRTWPRDKFERLMLGLFTRISGLAFDEFDESRNIAEVYTFGSERKIWFKHPLYAPEGEVIDVVHAWAAQDWGWNPAPGCQQLFVSDAYGRIFVVEEDYDTFVPVTSADPLEDSWCQRAARRNERWGLDAIYCDPESPGDIAAMQAYGLPAVKAVNKHEYGFDKVNAALHPMQGTWSSPSTGEPLPLGAGLFFGHNCVNLIRTIGSYVRQKDPSSDAYLPKAASNQEDHAEDTLRYGVVKDGKFGDEGEYPGVAPLILSAARGRGRGGRR